MKPLGDDDFSKLITSMFSAALGQSPWESFLGDLSSMSGGVKTHIFGFDNQINLTFNFTQSGYDEAFIKTFAEYYAPKNAWAPGFSRHPAGIPVDCEAMCSTEDLLKTEFYNDWLRHQEDIIQGGGGLLHKEESRVFALGGNIRLKDGDKLKGNWMHLVERIIPHAQQAFDVSRALAGAKLESHLIASNRLDQIPAIFSVSRSGWLLFANEAGNALIEEQAAVSKTLGGSLSFKVPRLGGVVDCERLWRAVLANHGSLSWKIPSSRSETLNALCFIVHPEVDAANALYKALWINEPTMMVLITRDQRPEQLSAQLQARYQLTDAEVDVALKLTDGLRIDEISDLRQVSKYTVRNQVKSILSKTGTNTQAELVRLIMGLMRG